VVQRTIGTHWQVITERLGAIARVRQRDVGVCNQFAMEYLAVYVEADLTFLDGLQVLALKALLSWFEHHLSVQAQAFSFCNPHLISMSKKEPHCLSECVKFAQLILVMANRLEQLS